MQFDLLIIPACRGLMYRRYPPKPTGSELLKSIESNLCSSFTLNGALCIQGLNSSGK